VGEELHHKVLIDDKWGSGIRIWGNRHVRVLEMSFVPQWRLFLMDVATLLQYESAMANRQRRLCGTASASDPGSSIRQSLSLRIIYRPRRIDGFLHMEIISIGPRDREEVYREATRKVLRFRREARIALQRLCGKSFER
jgi:hypothetical protein